MNPPQITYEYTVPKRILNRYAWNLRPNWTRCDRMCQGYKYRAVVCLNPESGEVVSDDYCPRDKKPPGEVLSCNEHCRLE